MKSQRALDPRDVPGRICPVRRPNGVNPEILPTGRGYTVDGRGERETSDISVTRTQPRVSTRLLAGPFAAELFARSVWTTGGRLPGRRTTEKMPFDRDDGREKRRENSFRPNIEPS